MSIYSNKALRPPGRNIALCAKLQKSCYQDYTEKACAAAVVWLSHSLYVCTYATQTYGLSFYIAEYMDVVNHRYDAFRYNIGHNNVVTRVEYRPDLQLTSHEYTLARQHLSLYHLFVMNSFWNRRLLRHIHFSLKLHCLIMGDNKLENASVLVRYPYIWNRHCSSEMCCHWHESFLRLKQSYDWHVNVQFYHNIHIYTCCLHINNAWGRACITLTARKTVTHS